MLKFINNTNLWDFKFKIFTRGKLGSSYPIMKS